VSLASAVSASRSDSAGSAMGCGEAAGLARPCSAGSAMASGEAAGLVHSVVVALARPAAAEPEAELATLWEGFSAAPAEVIKEQMLALLRRRMAPRRSAADDRSAATMASLSAQARSSYDESLVPESWRVPLSELAFVHQIGHGSTGTCYRAQWRGSSTVAVKVAHGGSESSWRSEVSFLARLRHPHVVQLLGAVFSPPTYCLVLEFCDGGDLHDALQQPTPPGFVMRVARGVASGMAYLHSRGVLHRDLKSANVLLDRHRQPKVTDFGTATDGVTNAQARRRGGALTAETGTYRWMAPEVINHEHYSRPADVFSFAMLLFELLSHEMPFADLPPVLAASATALERRRPRLPEGTPVAVARLMEQCWEAEPTDRPTFEVIEQALVQTANSLSTAEHAWLDAENGHPVTAKASGAGRTRGEPPMAAGSPQQDVQGLASNSKRMRTMNPTV